MTTIHFCEDGAPDIIVSADTEVACVKALWDRIKCDDGPLSEEPADLNALADAVYNAFGGECWIEIDEEN